MTKTNRTTVIRPVAAASAVDPVLPFTEIKIDGNVYKMCFDYDALAAAEAALISLGHDVNLLAGMLRLNFGTARVLFAASLLAYQPGVDFVASQKLVRRSNIFEILGAIDKAWADDMPVAKPSGSPQKPAQ